MANALKNNKKSATDKPEKVKVNPALSMERIRQIRLSTGIFLLLSGILTCMSIISYYFSWNLDQDKLLSGKSALEFIFKDTTPVSNWGGRLGAAISHYLVYKGAGVASLAIGIAVAALGLNLLYEKKVLPLLRYMRWVSILLLLLAPILSYLFPHTSYACPLGGAWGDVTIDYMNGLLGRAGTALALLSSLIFFLFVIIALDLGPLIRRMQERARKMAEALAASREFTPQQVEKDTDEEIVVAPIVTPKPAPEPKKVVNQDITDDKKPIEPAPKPGNKLNDQNGNIPLIIEDKRQNKDWNMAVVEKTPPTTPLVVHSGFNIAPDEEIPGQYLADEEGGEGGEDSDELLPEDAAITYNEKPPAQGKKPQVEEAEPDDWPEDEDTEEDTDFDNFDDDEPEEDEKPEPGFSVVMKQEEISPVVKHGAHISIADNHPFAPEETLRNYKYPTLDLLENRPAEAIALDKDELERNKEQIIVTLGSFGIEIKTIKATVGPTVTLYEIVPAEGVRISKIRNLEDDIALNLAALGIRIIAPIPGRGTIGIEVPNATKQIVSMRAMLSSEKFVNNKMTLPIALGKKIDNENYIVDLATMPHLLMAGATGQGKSVGINAILVSLLYKKHPSHLKFVMVDPKKVELSIYRTIEKHFLAKLPNEAEPIITDIKKVIYTLRALCDEMDDRYGLLKDAGSRNIKEYNEKFIARRLNPNEHKFLPYIVLVIDEFADLIMTAGKEVEMPIARLAQLSRAVGIHLIIATQRPSVNVITGTIKANFPARIAFKVSAKVDSRTILDTGGAEQLIGRGDMLISHGSELLRLQCAFVDTPEVERVVDFIGEQQGYPHAHPLPEPEMDEEDAANKSFDKKNRDKLFEDCARVVVQTQSGSTSMLQRRFNLGYNRAGRIMDQLEAAGIVGAASGSKPREVLFHSESELEEFFGTLE